MQEKSSFPSFFPSSLDWIEEKFLRGNLLAKYFLSYLKQKIQEENLSPTLLAILVGEDPASKIYVSNKRKKAQEVGIQSFLKEFPKDIKEEELIRFLQEKGEDPSIDGILLQLPLPPSLDVEKVLSYIPPQKDVDGFHPLNLGKLFRGYPEFIPCTPLGIWYLFKASKIPLEGKKVVILGRSNLVGKPLGILLLQENATISYLHSRSKDIESYTKEADILISATGKKDVLSPWQVSEDTIFIDVGIHRENGKIRGDIDTSLFLPKAKYITPVPGGIGPLTVAMLLYNTYLACKRKKESL